ncbi:DUF3048 domain-containing protein [Candidatus Saccharibacteria bacterium]|nr:DUF3048 domain-containing protein [Candidatus Saccharibacteria bacterium]
MKLTMSKKKIIIFSAIGVVLVAAITTAVIILLNQHPADKPVGSSETTEVEIPHYYSSLTGEEIASPADDNKPIFCIQIPNGLDGPRPQVGLRNAKVVFEAIAEAGITRFAAVFQDPGDSMLGPIRSLRPYYLDWDIPLGCSVVHAGGSYEAIHNLATTGTPEIDESTVYMWRDYSGYWAPNNLFTSGPLLMKWAADNGFTESHPKGWAHLTPEETFRIAEANQKSASEMAVEGSESPSEAPEASDPPVTLVTDISVNYGSSASFNTHYTYNPTTNSYSRSYASGDAGTSYTCLPGMDNVRPKNQCNGPEQLTPNVVAVMFMEEHRASDNYHEEINTIGSGRAVIFQNGIAIEGTWNKASQNEQIIFKDGSGSEIKLAVGQLWISAIPNYGSVNY